jgi:hypothetical protein
MVMFDHQDTMTTPHYLSIRENWQAEANKGGAAHEQDVASAFEAYFKTAAGADFEYIHKPKQLDQCFLEYQYKKNPSVYAKPAEPKKDDIYYDETSKRFKKYTGKSWTDAKEGMAPDGMIRCKTTGKAVCLEDKNQNDAGNAHERAYRYATPKVVKAIQEKLGITHQPVFWVFSGSIATNNKYIHEFAFHLDEDHYVLLKPTDDKATLLVAWFNRVIRPLLL